MKIRFKKPRYAVDRINQQGKILNSSRLSAQIEKIPPEDSFHASKRGDTIVNMIQDTIVNMIQENNMIIPSSKQLYRRY